MENWIDEKTGLACAIVTGPMGNLNGYVAVGPDHPWFAKGYSSDLCGHDGCYNHTPEGLIQVHGGITYAGHGVRGVEMNEGRWWFGFDTAHAGDLVPGLVEHGVSFGDDQERGHGYVKAEVESLAAQLADAPSPEGEHASW